MRRQGLKNTSAATRKRITTADPHDLDVIEWGIRRSFLNPVEWMRDDRPDLSYPSADDALAALLAA